MPAPHRSVFTGRMRFLPPNQQRQSTEGKIKGIWAVILCTNKILLFLTGDAS